MIYMMAFALDDARKERCSTCGWSKIIVEREERPYASRSGSKEILICKECQVMKNSTNVYARAAFKEYYDIATKGTKAPAKLDELVPGGASISSGPGAASKPKRGSNAWRNSGIERVYTSMDLRKWYILGTLSGSFWCVLMTVVLISLGVLRFG